jgi:hypothetical protein
MLKTTILPDFILLFIALSITSQPQSASHNIYPLYQIFLETKFKLDTKNLNNYSNVIYSSPVKISNGLRLNSKIPSKLNKAFISDSIDFDYIPWDAKRHFWLAAGEFVLVQFVPWAMAKWGRKWEDSDDNWANVTTETWWRNITYGWEYDGDAFLTNYFAHPYHGNLYYNIGRANGYNFWESGIWAFAGSALWEYLGETFRPSINDWVNTSLNGINLGEMLYRLSSMVTNNTASGWPRFWQEVGGTLLNPVRGFNRIITGEVSKSFPNPEEGKPNSFVVTLNAGVRRLDKHGDVNTFEAINEGILSVGIFYGNIFRDNLKVPFSAFDVSGAISLKVPNLTRLQSSGNLYGWHLKKSNTTKHLINFTLNYNYFDNPGFIYGGTSINSRLLSYFTIWEKTNLVANVGLGFIAMGATPNDYYSDPEGRNYDFGPGVTFNLGATIYKSKFKYLGIFYTYNIIWTQSIPTESIHHLHIFWANTEIPLISDFFLSIGYGVYWRNSLYSFEEDQRKRNSVGRISVKYMLY